MSRSQQNNPLFTRRPTPQQVTAYREAGLFRRLLEKYPEWGEEQGYLTKKERKGILSRLFGGRSKSSDVVIDEERFVEGIRRAKTADAEAVRRYASGGRPQTARPTTRAGSPKVSVSASPSSQESGLMGLTVPARPSPQEKLLGKLTVSRKSPETTSEVASVIAENVSGQDISEALDSKAVQAEAARDIAAQDYLDKSKDSPAPDSMTEPAEVTSDVAAKAGEGSSKENEPAKSPASNRDTKPKKTDSKLDELKRRVNAKLKKKGQWWTLYTIGTSGAPRVLGVLTNVKGKFYGAQYRNVVSLWMQERNIGTDKTGELVGKPQLVGGNSKLARAKWRSPEGIFDLTLMRWGYIRDEYAKSEDVKAVVDELLQYTSANPRNFLVNSWALLGKYEMAGKRKQTQSGSAGPEILRGSSTGTKDLISDEAKEIVAITEARQGAPEREAVASEGGREIKIATPTTAYAGGVKATPVGRLREREGARPQQADVEQVTETVSRAVGQDAVSVEELEESVADLNEKLSGSRSKRKGRRRKRIDDRPQEADAGKVEGALMIAEPARDKLGEELRQMSDKELVEAFEKGPLPQSEERVRDIIDVTFEETGIPLTEEQAAGLQERAARARQMRSEIESRPHLAPRLRQWLEGEVLEAVGARDNPRRRKSGKMRGRR